MVTSVAKGRAAHSEPDYIARAEALAEGFAARAAEHDRAGSFPFANFRELSEAGLLSLTVPAVHGGAGAGARYAARVIGIIGKADSSTALVLSMHYINHLVMGRSPTWPAKLSRKLARESVEGLALVNALRVEPELGSPARGGLPATIARRTETGWRLTGHKIYSTGSPILKWYLVWARTDEAEPRVGQFLVPAGLPGTRIVETWDHHGLRASGSHDVIFDDVVIPLDAEVDVRNPQEWRAPDVAQATVHTVFVAAIYDGVARAARDWFVSVPEAARPRQPRRAACDLAAGAGDPRCHRGQARSQCAADRDVRPRLRRRRRSLHRRIQRHQADGDQQRRRRGRGCTIADRQSRPVPHQSAGAALSRCPVRPRAHAAGRCHPHRPRPRRIGL